MNAKQKPCTFFTTKRAEGAPLETQFLIFYYLKAILKSLNMQRPFCKFKAEVQGFCPPLRLRDALEQH